jgi:hypothetical protein
LSFSQETTITTTSTGSVEVRNLLKRPIFLADNSWSHGFCLSCNRPTACPICDVDPGSDGDGDEDNQKCLEKWTLIIKGGSDSGDTPMFDGTKTTRCTVSTRYIPAKQHLWGGGGGGRGDFETQSLYWPTSFQKVVPKFWNTMIVNDASDLGLYIGQYSFFTSDVENGKRNVTPRFEGFGLTVVLTRRWVRGPCKVTTTPTNNISWPYRDAWTHPQTPVENPSQWLYAKYGPIQDWCHRPLGNSPGPLQCGWWGGYQTAIYHTGNIGIITDKIRCDDFAGIEVPLAVTSQQTWSTRQYKRTPDYDEWPSPVFYRAPLPTYWEDWSGTPPSITVVPTTRTVFNTSAAAKAGAAASVSVEVS